MDLVFIDPLDLARRMLDEEQQKQLVIFDVRDEDRAGG